MNRLSESTSLYLQQHADNPVEWEPWDDRALERARRDKKPILLSIGYSACHWCHVMAHESFEDPETARWMNALFVNIKVDREERPDLDRIYQLSHQLLTGRGGGWPLTVFLDPEHLTPFFAGTYFPPEPRHNLPGFSDLLKKARQWFDLHPEDVEQQASQLREAINGLQQGSATDGPPGPEVFERLPEHLQRSFDPRHGGFGGAPKFPQAPLLGLVQALAEGNHPEADEMLQHSLERMALSGLRDHLDGGFFRYCVDGEWTIPHFEKMLYDNAMLLPLYAETASRRNDPFLARTAEGIVDWLEQSMLHENGGFSASIDADADGEEGGFHVWQREEVRALLGDQAFAGIESMLGLDQSPNFEDSAWHLLRHDEDTRRDLPAAAREVLLRARDKRIPPATDRKQIASWNALCADGLARAGAALQRPDWLEQAAQTMDFVRDHLWHDGRLHAVYAGGRAQFPAYLDDHAGLMMACLSLLRARWREEDFTFAITLGDALLEHFLDAERGGFHFTAADAEAPMQRLRSFQDDALPSGNGLAARDLLQLGHLCGDARYLAAARDTLAAARQDIAQYPLAHAAMLVALEEYLDPPAQVIVRGQDTDGVERLSSTVREFAAKGLRVHCYTTGQAAAPGILEEAGVPRSAQAIVCRGTHCLPPAGDPAELMERLNQSD